MIVRSESYWNDLLDRYKSGSISEEDRYELEKHALDDPFLFDALEGYELYGDSEKELKPKPKLFNLPRLAAAASLVFLVSMVFLLKKNNAVSSEAKQRIAMVLKDEKIEDPVAVDIKAEEVITKNENESKATESIVETQIPESDEDVKPNQSNQRTKKKEATKQKNKEAVSMVANTKIPVGSSKTKTEANSYEEEIEDEEGTVAVSVNERLEPIEAADSAPEVSNQNKAKANANASFGETTDISISKEAEVRSRKIEEEVKVFYVVEPEIGKADFDDFVKQRIDALNLRQTPQVETVIEFTINPDGSIGEYTHIINGEDGCSACGAQAIAILANSGVWKTTPAGSTGRARYKFIF